MLDKLGSASDREVRIPGSDMEVIWSSVMELGEISYGSSSLPLPSSLVSCPATNEPDNVEITRWPAYVCIGRLKHEGRLTSQLKPLGCQVFTHAAFPHLQYI